MCFKNYQIKTNKNGFEKLVERCMNDENMRSYITSEHDYNDARKAIKDYLKDKVYIQDEYIRQYGKKK